MFPENRWPNGNRWRIGSGIALFCLLAYLPALMALARGAHPIGGDALSAFGPWRDFTRQCLEQGYLPLWNPHIFCGMPFLSNGQSAVLYPPNVIYLLLPMPWALWLDAYAHNVLLACGGYALARALRMSQPAALLTATLFAVGGAVSARVYAGHMTWHASRAYLPWLLWATLLFLRGGQKRHALLAVALSALLLAAGHPMIATLGHVLAVALIIAYLLIHRQKWQSIAWATGFMAVLLAMALGAVSVLPLQEAAGLAVRNKGMPYWFVVIGSGTWRTFARLLLPGFFGGNSEIQWSAQYFPHEEVASIGIMAALLALGAPVLARRDNRVPPAVPWLWLAMFLAAVLAVGRHTGVYRWAFDHLPVFASMRVPVRWMELWFFAAAILAGFSFDGCRFRIQQGMRRDATLVLSIVLALLAALFFALESWLISTNPDGHWLQIAQRKFAPGTQAALEAAASLRWSAVFASLFGGIIAAAAAFLLWRWRQATPLRRPVWERLLLGLMATELLILFWRSASPVEPGEFGAYIDWPRQIEEKEALNQRAQRWDTNFRGRWAEYAWNSGVPRGVDLFNGYDPFAPQRFFDFASHIEGGRFFSYQYQPVRRTELLRVAGVTHTLSAPSTSPPSTTYAAPRLSRRFEAWSLWSHDEAWPRVYLSQRVLALRENQQLLALEQLAKGNFEKQGKPVVVAPDALQNITEKAPAGKISRWTRSANRWDIDLQTSAPTVLVVGDNHYPGWRAYVTRVVENNSESRQTTQAPIVHANYLFRAVALPSGTRHVTMVYEPQTFRFAVFLSLAGLAGLCAVVSLQLFKGKS